MVQEETKFITIWEIYLSFTQLKFLLGQVLADFWIFSFPWLFWWSNWEGGKGHHVNRRELGRRNLGTHAWSSCISTWMPVALPTLWLQFTACQPGALISQQSCGPSGWWGPALILGLLQRPQTKIIGPEILDWRFSPLLKVPTSPDTPWQFSVGVSLETSIAAT